MSDGFSLGGFNIVVRTDSLIDPQASKEMSKHRFSPPEIGSWLVMDLTALHGNGIGVPSSSSALGVEGSLLGPTWGKMPTVTKDTGELWAGHLGVEERYHHTACNWELCPSLNRGLLHRSSLLHIEDTTQDSMTLLASDDWYGYLHTQRRCSPSPHERGTPFGPGLCSQLACESLPAWSH